MGLITYLTIVVPIFFVEDLDNRLRWLHKCVESCAKQVPVPGFETKIELWNDGSPSPRVAQAIKVLARRFNCDVYECTREGHTTAGWIMNQTLNNCDSPYIFWIGCDDEIHPLFVQSNYQAWQTRGADDKILGTATDCMKEIKIDGEVVRQKFAAASSPMYDTEIIKSHQFDEKIKSNIDGTFQKHFIDQGYRFRKVQLPLYLYRFHENQLSKKIHYDMDSQNLSKVKKDAWVKR